jgi:hypothetical protein
VIDSVPRLCPTIAGVKVIETGQLDPTLSCVPQEFVVEKSPVIAMLLILSPALPLLVRIMVLAPETVPVN